MTLTLCGFSEHVFSCVILPWKYYVFRLSSFGFQSCVAVNCFKILEKLRKILPLHGAEAQEKTIMWSKSAMIVWKLVLSVYFMYGCLMPWHLSCVLCGLHWAVGLHQVFGLSEWLCYDMPCLCCHKWDYIFHFWHHLFLDCIIYVAVFCHIH